MLANAIFASLLFSVPLSAKVYQDINDLNINSLSGKPTVSSKWGYQHNNLEDFPQDKDEHTFDFTYLKNFAQNTLLTHLGNGKDWSVGSLLLSSLQHTLSDSNTLKTVVTDGLGLHEDFVKLLMKFHQELDKVALSSTKGNILVSDDVDKHQSIDNQQPMDINWQILNAMKNAFAGKFTNFTSVDVLDNLPLRVDDSQNMTASSAWMVVKSTWQRILAYVKEEHSLHRFMQLTPVRIIDKVLSLGDDISIAGFLAQKLHPDFAIFLSDRINPHLGPFRDFNTFYNYTSEYSLNGFIDYFTSQKFTYTINAFSKFISAYFDDTFSDDVVDQYIAFISLNNTELYNFYKSIVLNQKHHNNGTKSGREKREDINKAINGFKYDGYDFEAKDYKTLAEKLLAARDSGYGSGGHSEGGGGYGHSGGGGGYGHSGGGGGYGHSGGGGGYGHGGGGGGYGGGGHGGGSMTTDPAVLLSSIALGALLGFLLFRLINGSRFFGKRDINDGSLSLWLSDVPEDLVPWGTNAERMKRNAPQGGKEAEERIELPASLRGEVWSTDPFMGDKSAQEEQEGEDMADHLNHLWVVYNETHEAECVQSQLCNTVTKGTAEYLTGKDSSIAILLASVSNLMGVPKAGQMVDDVIQTLVVGSHYACPTQTHCLQAF